VITDSRNPDVEYKVYHYNKFVGGERIPEVQSRITAQLDTFNSGMGIPMHVARKAENLRREFSDRGWKPAKMNREDAISEPKHHFGLYDEKKRRGSEGNDRNFEFE
jgi:hypothetical protein